MRIRTTLAAGLLLATAALTFTACDPDTAAKSSPAASSGVATQSAATTTPGTPVPNFVGMGLQDAQDSAQAKGFYALTSHDASGQDRMQILDSNWTVCDQTPTAGSSADASVEIDMGAVKTDETCPGAAPTTTPAPTATPSPTRTTATPHPKPSPTVTHHTSATTSGGSGTSSSTGGGSTYTEPTADGHGGATALCNDGTLSYSAHHRGTCSHHGGVAEFYN